MKDHANHLSVRISPPPPLGLRHIFMRKSHRLCDHASSEKCLIEHYSQSMMHCTLRNNNMFSPTFLELLHYRTIVILSDGYCIGPTNHNGSMSFQISKLGRHLSAPHNKDELLPIFGSVRPESARGSKNLERFTFGGNRVEWHTRRKRRRVLRSFSL